jgi:hypothetical protein
MGRVDFDALRAEAAEEPHEVTVGGVTYKLRATLPPAVIAYLAPPGFDPEHPETVAGFIPDFVSVARALLLDGDAETFAMQFDQDEWERLFELYGLSLGESLASPGSSLPTPVPSRPTSPSTTASPSPVSTPAI